MEAGDTMCCPAKVEIRERDGESMLYFSTPSPYDLAFDVIFILWRNLEPNESLTWDMYIYYVFIYIFIYLNSLMIINYNIWYS